MIAVIVPVADSATTLQEVLLLAEEFSPRIECGASSVALDASGVSRLFGNAEGLARMLLQQAAARGLHVRVAVAATRTAAALSAVGLDPIVIPPGAEAAALAPLPLARLAAIDDLIGPALAKAAAGAPKRRRKGQGRHYRLAPAPETAQSINQEVNKCIERLERWGLKTLDDLARLPASELSARLGQAGLVLQRAARGEDERPLVPSTGGVSFMQSLQLEWPVDDLQPLAFIVARLCDSLERALAQADRGAVTLTTMLRLVTKEAYARTLALPSPMRDARVLRTLVMLDLESHPPDAAIDEVIIDVDVAPGRILQTGLFEPALPAPEALSTLVARLGAVAGTSRVGAPVLVDTHRPGAFEIKPFAPHEARPQATGHRPQGPAPGDKAPVAFSESQPGVVPAGSGPRPMAYGLWPTHLPAVIRRFRPPRVARVRVGPLLCPVRVDAGEIRGDVLMAAGPWRNAGGWWSQGWDRDEWDVSLENGVTCRLVQDRATGKWVIDGVLD